VAIRQGTWIALRIWCFLNEPGGPDIAGALVELCIGDRRDHPQAIERDSMDGCPAQIMWVGTSRECTSGDRAHVARLDGHRCSFGPAAAILDFRKQVSLLRLITAAIATLAMKRSNRKYVTVTGA
jgi:hypothetical protein